MDDTDDPTSPPPRGPAIGLVIRRGKAKYARPAAGFASKAARPLAKVELAPLRIDSHKALAVQQRALAERVAAHPDLAVMLLINPVLAFKALGVELSADVASHVLHAIQHPPALRSRREALEEQLRKALGEPAQPNDAAWNARLLFTLRKLAPLAIGEQTPAYTPPLGEPQAQALQALRPAGGVRYPQARRLPPRSRVGSVAWNESLRRMDLNAPAPRLPTVSCAPTSVPLEDLWFYKDLDPVVRDALELGIIQRRAFPIHTPDSFRQVLAGDRPNAFRHWVRRVGFNPA